jgi:hypothetical protein
LDIQPIPIDERGATWAGLEFVRIIFVVGGDPEFLAGFCIHAMRRFLTTGIIEVNELAAGDG